MEKIYVYYRISDTPAWAQKNKPAYINNKNCLINFLENFHPDSLHVIADSVNEQTVKYLNSVGKTHGFFQEHVQNKSGSKTFAYVIDLALTHSDEDIVYFVEDDFLHCHDSKKILKEAFQETDADYVTLYDNPDKYINRKDGGPNPFVRNGGERTRVITTSSTHWKTTNSTVLTFAARVGTLKADRKEWRRCVSSNVPKDFLTFIRLTKTLFFLRLFKTKRTLIHPVPGRATHGEIEYLSPFIDWESVSQRK
jgi:hypothetical protein